MKREKRYAYLQLMINVENTMKVRIINIEYLILFNVLNIVLDYYLLMKKFVIKDILIVVIFQIQIYQLKVIKENVIVNIGII